MAGVGYNSLMSAKTRSKDKKAKPQVTRKFLMDLANKIYNPRTRKFLRLCDGTLQNGPDPTNKRRPMHCGLGELYYEMTGLQPHATQAEHRKAIGSHFSPPLEEEDVVELAYDRSTLKESLEKRHKELTDALDVAFDLSRFGDALSPSARAAVNSSLRDVLYNELDLSWNTDVYSNSNTYDPGDISDDFRRILNEIPGENDDDCGDVCTKSEFIDRSKRVAALLRKAAGLLPE